MSTQKRRGFTLIELMIVVVIIGIWAAIAIPNFISMQDRRREAEVKNSMHTVQVAAEEYAVRYDGLYPVNPDDLLPFLPNGQLVKNVFTGFVTEPVMGFATEPGQIGYAGIIEEGVCVGYIITGYGKEAQILTIRSGQE